MKRILISLVLLIGGLYLYSQAPEGFSYQAIVRDNGGNPLVNQAVSFRFTIIKGSPLGTSVFEETHNVTTDAFGVVSLIINNGTGKIGSFENIDWGTDAYFLKVEIDKTGGTSYTDMGTTQLLSVPYSLFSKKAGNGFSGNYNDLSNKPITDGSETKLSAGSHIIISGTGTSVNPYIVMNAADGSETKLSAGSHIVISGTGTSTDPYVVTNAADGTETKVSAGNLIDVTGTGTSADPYVISGSNGSETKMSGGDNIIISGSGTSADPYIINERIHTVGESYGGGVVFYVYDNGRHGLIAASTDQDPGIQWYNGTKRYTNTTGDGVNAGEMNTTLIIALLTNDNPMGNFAAKVCADYSATGDGMTYGDWYLPSKYELALLFFNKDKVGGFTNDYYWSSTEFSSVSSWCQNFATGIQYNLNKNIPYKVRAIRAF